MTKTSSSLMDFALCCCCCGFFFSFNNIDYDIARAFIVTHKETMCYLILNKFYWTSVVDFVLFIFLFCWAHNSQIIERPTECINYSRQYCMRYTLCVFFKSFYLKLTSRKGKSVIFHAFSIIIILIWRLMSVSNVAHNFFSLYILHVCCVYVICVYED